MRAFRHITLVSVLALGGGGCRVAPSVSVIDSSTKRAASAPIHEAVRRANRGGPAPRWTLEAAQELSGLSVEQYRLGAGPTLLLLPDPASPATTVQVWLPFGWGDEPRGRRGRLRRWAGGWPSSPLGAAHPVEASSGVARDLTRASWTLAAEDLLPVLDTVVAQWPTRTSTPSLSALADLELRMRRALWEASDATARTEPDLDAARAVWAIAGRFDRAAVLRKFRAVARTTLRARPADVPRRAPGRGPRIMLELEGPPARPALLVGWALGASDPETIVGLEALANLLIQTRGSNLLPALGLEGAALSVEAGPAGVSLEAWLSLERSGTATAAASGLRAMMGEAVERLDRDRSLERLRQTLVSQRLRDWTSLEGRATRAAEAVLLFGDISALHARWNAETNLEASTLKRFAQRIAKRWPVTVTTRPH